MKDSPDVTPRVDRIARIVCLAIGAALAAATWIVHAGAGPAFAYWLCGVGAIVLLVAGTVGPPRLRAGLVTWLPWL